MPYRTINTEHWARWIKALETLPSYSSVAGVWPRVPATIMEAFIFIANSTISLALFSVFPSVYAGSTQCRSASQKAVRNGAALLAVVVQVVGAEFQIGAECVACFGFPTELGVQDSEMKKANTA